jgi:hypothetical protein
MKNVINRDSLRRIVNESVSEILFEAAREQMSFGVAGPIPVEPAASLCDDVNPSVLELIDNPNKKIPRRHIGSPKYFGNTKIWDAYVKYKDAITRKRSETDFFTFLKKIRTGWYGGPLQVFEKDGSYLIGTMRVGVFLCVYICPKNAGIALFKFIKDVCQYDNVVFSVTSDMASMLERLGCPKYEGTVSARYKGGDCEKSVYATTKEAAIKGAKLVGLMGKSGKFGNNIKDTMIQNPKTNEFLKDNPNLPFDIMNIPAVTELLMDRPEIIDTINDNPSIMQKIVDNPMNGFMDFLKSYKAKRVQQAHINERKNMK